LICSFCYIIKKLAYGIIGGFPAFLAGIITHFVIGYTTIVHLLPAYVAVALYIFGLVFTYSFLMKGENK